ncbi:YTH family RNA binding protein Mmi1 [Pelomyxa schiedti]|nr:YTH family RNA binding protein Mmi1 [Pelomyxa schiedti]
MKTSGDEPKGGEDATPTATPGPTDNANQQGRSEQPSTAFIEVAGDNKGGDETVEAPAMSPPTFPELDSTLFGADALKFTLDSAHEEHSEIISAPLELSTSPPAARIRLTPFSALTHDQGFCQFSLDLKNAISPSIESDSCDLKGGIYEQQTSNTSCSNSNLDIISSSLNQAPSSGLFDSINTTISGGPIVFPNPLLGVPGLGNVLNSVDGLPNSVFSAFALQNPCSLETGTIENSTRNVLDGKTLLENCSFPSLFTQQVQNGIDTVPALMEKSTVDTELQGSDVYARTLDNTTFAGLAVISENSNQNGEIQAALDGVVFKSKPYPEANPFIQQNVKIPSLSDTALEGSTSELEPSSTEPASIQSSSVAPAKHRSWASVLSTNAESTPPPTRTVPSTKPQSNRKQKQKNQQTAPLPQVQQPPQISQPQPAQTQPQPPKKSKHKHKKSTKSDVTGDPSTTPETSPVKSTAAVTSSATTSQTPSWPTAPAQPISPSPLPASPAIRMTTLPVSLPNPMTIDCNPTSARFFVIKSFSEDDIHKSIKYEIWASTDTGNARLDCAYKESSLLGPIYLMFSVNGSGQFCGVAKMTSPVDYTTRAQCWQQVGKWKGKFSVKWILIKDVPNALFRHLTITTMDNEIKPVTNSRDTQEVPLPYGCEMLRIFVAFKSRRSLLDDFEWYEQKQQQETELQQQQQKSALPTTPAATATATVATTPQLGIPQMPYIYNGMNRAMPPVMGIPYQQQPQMVVAVPSALMPTVISPQTQPASKPVTPPPTTTTTTTKSGLGVVIMKQQPAVSSTVSSPTSTNSSSTRQSKKKRR